jgi:bacterioferritin-associated ferredoxin
VDQHLQELLERGVAALERLAEDEIDIRVETMPPVCPHCEKINPTVRVAEKNQQGPLAEFVLQAHCLNCNNIFYVIPIQSECVKSVDDAKAVMAEKTRIGGYERENSAAPV